MELDSVWVGEVVIVATGNLDSVLKPGEHAGAHSAVNEVASILILVFNDFLEFGVKAAAVLTLLSGHIDHIGWAITRAASMDSFASIFQRAAERKGDQAVGFGGGKLVMSDLEKMLGLVDHGHVSALLKSIAEGDAEAMLAMVEELVAQSRDLEAVLLKLAETLHRVTLLQCAPGYRDSERSDWDAIEKLASMMSAEDAQLFYQIAIKGRNELGLAPDPRTGLEMTLLRMLAFRPAAAAASSPAGGAGKVSAPSRSAAAKKSQAAAAPAEARTRTHPQARPAKPTREPAVENTAAGAGRATAQTAPAAGGSDWMQLLENLNLSGQVRELARNVQLKSRSDDRWDFVIAPALRHLGSKNCVNRLGQAISESMGHPVNIRILDEEGGELQTAAALEEQKLRQSMSEAEKAINDDPTVKSLKEQMGARLVEDSIQPLQ